MTGLSALVVDDFLGTTSAPVSSGACSDAGPCFLASRKNHGQFASRYCREIAGAPVSGCRAVASPSIADHSAFASPYHGRAAAVDADLAVQRRDVVAHGVAREFQDA